MPEIEDGDGAGGASDEMPNAGDFIPDLATLEWAGIRLLSGDLDREEPEGTGSTWLDDLVHPERGPVEWLGELAPSGRLFMELESLPAEVVDDDYAAVELVSHWHRLEAHCAGRKREAAAALARRHAMSAGLAALAELNGGLGVVTQQPNIAADELTSRLGIGTIAARRLIESGQAFGGVGIPVAEALAAGEVDAVKADMIVGAVADLEPEVALEVQERVLSRASHLPSGSVRRELAAACAAIDPAEFEDRAAAAAKRRRVCRPRVLAHGMAGFYAELPAFEATQLWRAVDAAARAAKSGGDARTMDQLRADALALLGTTAVQTGWIGVPHGESRAWFDSGGGDGARDGTGDVTGAGAGAGAGVGSGFGAGGGRAGGGACAAGGPRPTGGSPPLACPPMRIGTIGGRSAHVRVVVPLHTMMPIVRLRRGSGPRGAPRELEHPDRADHLEPPDHLEPADRAGPLDHPDEPDPPEAPDVPDRPDHPDHPDHPDRRDRPDHPDEPAFLEGYGPIPGSVARAIAAGSVWSRMVLDPLDGTVRELTTPKYRPPAAMADLVRAEQPECSMPGCSQPADDCDLDHLLPWPIGSTCVDGLGPLCRRHHLLRTHAGWSFTTSAGRRNGSESGRETPDGRDENGSGGGESDDGSAHRQAACSGRGTRALTRTWTTAAGHVYTEHPDGVLTHAARDDIGSSGSASGWPYLDEPPPY